MKRELFISIVSLILALLSAEALVRGVALINPTVHWLATFGRPKSPKNITSYSQFRERYPRILKPYRVHRSYYTNSLGFNDTEFSTTSEGSGKRILAFGDSFCWGVVPYSHSVLTLLEKEVRRAPDQADAEIYNLCIPGTGIRDYRMHYSFAAKYFPASTVLVHIYLGNDPPNACGGLDFLVVPKADRSARASYSYFWNFSVNAINALRSQEEGYTFEDTEPPPAGIHGGMRREDGVVWSDNRPPLSNATYTKQAFKKVRNAELCRLTEGNPTETTRRWEVFFEAIDGIIQTAYTYGHQLRFVLYPSELQLYPKKFERAVKHFIEPDKIEEGFRRDFDRLLPNRRILKYCLENNLNCFDLTPKLFEVAQKTRGSLYVKRDTHWNIKGNAEAARIQVDTVFNNYQDTD